MRKLKINKLVYKIQTVEDNFYGATIPFKDGLNIIYGPNSVGKTSIVTGLIYGLGSEKGLGIFKSGQNPFKPEFYQIINGEQVKKSFLLLEISNGIKDITIFRYITGGDINIAAVKECQIDNFFKTDELRKLIVVGEGVFSENGFQNFLFDFLNIQAVELPTYDQKYSKLYFENILPLFFVEQRAGWSQIQARQVLRYNIKDVKKVSFEYLFGLDRFNVHLSELKLRELESHLKKATSDLESKEENLLIISNAEKIDEIPIINTKFIGKTSIYDYIKYLKDKYKVESEFITNVSGQNKEFEDSNTKLRENIKRLDYEFRHRSTQIEKITIEIDGYNNYLERIKSNKYKNKQLKKIQEFSIELNVRSCPVCEANLTHINTDECFLCHADLNKKISSPDQNLAFLEDEETTFKKVISQRNIERKKIIEERNNIKDKINLYESQLDHQTRTYAGKEFALLRQRILEVDATHKEMEKYARIEKRWADLNPIRSRIKSLKIEHEKLKAKIDQYSQTDRDNYILNTIKTYIHSNVKDLGLFKGNQKMVNAIKLDSNDNYSPYLDNYDIYNISSSSDNIRIILSYYLALLQTSTKLKNDSEIKYPNLLILDEPKQQNLDNDSLINCINTISKIPPSSGQIILTTYSELPEDRESLKEFIVYEMSHKKDYLLKKMKKQ